MFVTTSKKFSNRKAKKRSAVLPIVVAGLMVVGGYTLWRHTFNRRHLAVDSTLLHSLKQQANTTTLPVHLSAGLLPPTNRWFSGLVFTQVPNPVYPLPLSFQADDSGFSMGLPTVKSTPNTIYGENNPAVSLQGSADSFAVSRYDAVSVTLTYSKAGVDMGEATVAEGSPYVSYTAKHADSLTLAAAFSKVADQTYSTTISGVTYGLYTTATVGTAGNETTLSAQPGDVVMLYPLATGSSVATMAAFARAPLSSVAATDSVSASTAVTTLRYNTPGSQPTLFAALPDQHLTTGQQVAGTYSTIYGSLQLYSGSSFSFAVPTVEPSDTLPVTTLSAAAKQELVTQLKIDAAGTELTKTDSYYGGKELYRAANLYQLALQLGQKDIASALHAQLVDTFNQWLDPTGYQTRDDRYFYYDTTLKGLVGMQASFGSDQFNDHHFHYGYFLYAAAIVAAHDSSFKQQHAAFLNLIASDIAAPTASAYFPKERLFDPYFGHSWASGNGAFADGNDQESSSEAASAWNGAALWGKVSGDAQLQTTATWMLSREAAASRADWTDVPTTQAPFNAGYAHQIVGINWGGKRDYATFFSASPNAMLGIQLIPMNPSMTYLKREVGSIPAKLSEALGGNYNQQFADYLLMYQALSDPKIALTQARNLNAAYIDDANSRTYLLAWILSQ